MLVVVRGPQFTHDGERKKDGNSGSREKEKLFAHR